MGEDAIAELFKQGGLAVGLGAVVLLGLQLLRMLKDALDKQEARNDAMREDLSHVADALEKLATANEALKGQIEGLALRMDYQAGRRRPGA